MIDRIKSDAAYVYYNIILSTYLYPHYLYINLLFYFYYH